MGDRKDLFSLSRNSVPGSSIYMKDSVGVQNRLSGSYRRMPFLAPIKGHHNWLTACEAKALWRVPDGQTLAPLVAG
jgi:hypothetical protein